MAISYKKLFKLLIDRDLKKKDLRDMTGISYATLHKLERGENMMAEVIPDESIPETEHTTNIE